MLLDFTGIISMFEIKARARKRRFVSGYYVSEYN